MSSVEQPSAHPTEPEPSLIDTLTTVSRYTFADIIGLSAERLGELTLLKDCITAPNYWAEKGIHIPRIISIQGPPASGKTHIAEALVGEIAPAQCFHIDYLSIIDEMRGDPLGALQEIIDYAHNEPESIVVLCIDQYDIILKSSPNGPAGMRLNNFLDEKETLPKNLTVLLVGGYTTDESSLVRSGRIDYQVDLALPDKEERRAMLEHIATLFPSPSGPIFDNSIDWDAIAQKTDEFNYAALLEIVRGCVNKLIYERVAEDSTAIITTDIIAYAVHDYLKQRGRAMKNQIGFPLNSAK